MATKRTIAIIKAKFTLYRLAFREDTKSYSLCDSPCVNRSPIWYARGGGGVLPIMAYIRGGSARKEYLFEASGI